MKRILLITILSSFSLMATQAAVDPNFYIYLCFGQSNMEGNAQPEAIDRQDVGTRFRMLATCNFTNPQRTVGNWYNANCPIVSPNGGLGMADYFGRTMIANLPQTHKVGVVAVAMGGSPIEMFDKDKYQQKLAENPSEWWAILAKNHYGGNPYGRLVEMGKKAQQVGVIKGILLHQGCSNCGDPNWPAMVKKIYDDLLADLNLTAADVPLFVGETERADMGGGCSYHNTVVAQVPNVIPTAYVISSEGIPGNGTDAWHFSAAGYRMFGKRYAIKALSLMGIDVEDDTQAPDNSEFEQDQKLTSLSELSGKAFVIYNENTHNAFYGSENQNLGYASLASALLKTNATICFKAEPSGSNYLLRALTPAGTEYMVFGQPGYLNSQPTTGWCSFILGLNNQNGQDVENGAVWEITYVANKGFTLRNMATGKYLQDAAPAKYDSPAYFSFYTIREKGTNGIDAPTTDRERQRGARWYSLDGRLLPAKPAQPGIYISNGKKIAIR